jgi:Leucine-rich repeat (LRR) protein
LYYLEGLDHLPDDLWQLPDLRELDVEGCDHIEQIPDNIPADAKLEGLRINRGKHERLPSSLCALSNLTRLDIGTTCTEALPDQLSRLTSLRILSLERTRVSCFPPNMERLVNLEDVQLCNMRADIGGAFSKPMPGMRRLRITNAANTHDLDMSGLTGLTELSIGLFDGEGDEDGEDDELHTSIGSLGSLKRLVLENCAGLTTLPAEIGQLTNLTALHMDSLWEDFTLPKTISGLISLRELVIDNDRYSEFYLPPTIRLPAALTALMIKCPVSCIPASYTNLTRLRDLELHCADGTLDSPPALSKLPSLRGLTLRICDLWESTSFLHVAEMLTHASLTRLSMHFDNKEDLALVHEILPTLTGLRELNLFVAEISNERAPDDDDISSPIANLSRLTLLRLIGAPGGLIPPWVFQPTSLQALHIDTHHMFTMGSSKEPARLSPAVTSLANLRDLRLPKKTILPTAITRLTKLTSVHVREDGDAEHQEAVRALLSRKVKVQYADI